LATDGLTGSIYLTASNIRDFAFFYQPITGVNAPHVLAVGSSAFTGCSSLETANFPDATTVGNYAFQLCSSLTTANFQTVTSIGSYAFRSCYNLVSLYLESIPSVPTLDKSAFYATPIGGYSYVTGRYGSVFVPASLDSSFLTSANWSSIASCIVSV
jgi:hypothetical protein